MNKLILALCALTYTSLTASANSQIQTAEYYAIEFWLGEYPAGYQINSNTSVTAIKEPTNPTPVGECTLKAKSVIHPWATKTKSEFLTLSPVYRFRALSDFELYREQGEGLISVKTGDEVIQLSYLSEGFCLMSHGGELATESCLEMDTEKAELVSASPLSYREFFRTSCTEGHTAWIEGKELSSRVEEAGDVEQAEILDYGTVREP